MLEALMNVRSDPPSATTLETSEGALVSISISVEPQALESLLEALAGVAFPVNPQIYHDAAVVSRFADGRELSEAITLVEFPAYAGKLEEVRRSLAAFGFDPACIQVTAMLEEIQSQTRPEPVPPGADYVQRYRVKCRTMVA
jgi:hypothetical protein